jgi:hypothetical protein
MGAASVAAEEIEMFTPDMDPVTGHPGTAPFDEQRRAAAEVLENVADDVETRSARVNHGVVREFSSRAKRTLGDAAAYVRQHDARDMAKDFQQFAAVNPVPMLVGAVAAGFLVGRMLRRH